jgi:hypothetical protein
VQNPRNKLHPIYIEKDPQTKCCRLGAGALRLVYAEEVTRPVLHAQQMVALEKVGGLLDTACFTSDSQGQRIHGATVTCKAQIDRFLGIDFP